MLPSEMGNDADSPLDRLWQEYGLVFKDFDNLSLARWMAQTLGQIDGRIWRLSHPLMGAYRLAAQIAHERQIWLQRLATAPHVYTEAPCCRAPLLPLFTRDVREAGLVCLHCNETAVPLEELPENLQKIYKEWAEAYNSFHSVAHWEERQKSPLHQYEEACEGAAREIEKLLAQAGQEMVPPLLDLYPAVIWEDQDECLQVRPEDISFKNL